MNLSGTDARKGHGGIPRPAVVKVPWGPGEWALAVQPGSSVVDLLQALGELPGEVKFAAAFGDVDVVLVYRLETDLPTRRQLLTLHGSVLDIPDAAPDRSRWMTSGERQAFRAGYDEALTTVRLFVSQLAGASDKDLPSGEAPSD